MFVLSFRGLEKEKFFREKKSLWCFSISMGFIRFLVARGVFDLGSNWVDLEMIHVSTRLAPLWSPDTSWGSPYKVSTSFIRLMRGDGKLTGCLAWVTCSGLSFAVDEELTKCISWSWGIQFWNKEVLDCLYEFTSFRLPFHLSTCSSSSP